MGYLKFVAYLYLAIAVFFIYNGIVAINEGENGYVMFALALASVFLFFFRRRYAKKFEQRDKN